jgi:hypothetical protein
LRFICRGVSPETSTEPLEKRGNILVCLPDDIAYSLHLLRTEFQPDWQVRVNYQHQWSASLQYELTQPFQLAWQENGLQLLGSELSYDSAPSARERLI